MFVVYMYSKNIKYELVSFDTEKEAVEFCNDNGWEWFDGNNFMWSLDVEEV